MPKIVKYCLAYTDFLGASALSYSENFGHSYRDDICVYAISAALTEDDKTHTYSNDILDYLSKVSLSNLSWDLVTQSNQIKFAVSNSANFMSYNFKLSDITTESDTESDIPYSYEELFNECVLANMDSSTGMQYKDIYVSYNSMPNEEVSHAYMPGVTTKQLALNNFYTSNNLASSADFVRSDYYKFFVPETDIIHNRSMLELNDDALASIGNQSHDSFNCLMFCVNKNYNEQIQEHSTIPAGFTNSNYKVIPISICIFSKDIILAGNNVKFEPNLNGVVTVE